MGRKTLGARLATVTAATAVTLMCAGGAASASTSDEARQPGYDGGWVSISYSDAQDRAVAYSSQDHKPWLEYKLDLPLGLGAIDMQDREAETSYGRAEDRQATDGPFRACVDTGMDLGGSANPSNVVCTKWVNGR